MDIMFFLPRSAAIALILLVAAPAIAGSPAAITFDEAVRLALARSDALAGARAHYDSQAHHAASLEYLDYPRVEFDAKALASEKTATIDLGGVKSAAGDALTSVLGSAGAAAVSAQIPSSTVFGMHNSGVQAQATATLPLYTGGKIDAAQQAAAAATRQAGAELTLAEQRLRVEVAQTYFLYQLTLKVRAVRLDVRDGVRRHLDNAKAAEKAGIIPHSQTLQAQVAFDETERQLAQAEADVASVAVALGNLLHLPSPPLPATPLFVIARPLPPRKAFLAAALSGHGQILRLMALEAQSAEGVRIERSARLPQLYLFGEYNLAGRGLLGHDRDFTVPDWAFGVGMKYALFSGIDRSEAEQAAVKQQARVQAILRQTRVDLTTAIMRAYNDAEAARSRFALLSSSLTAARENVRTQEAAFRAGMATSVDVTDARLALSRAAIERAEAAWRFDAALARLLFASGQADSFSEYIAKADQVIAHE